MDVLILSRVQFAITITFHIIFPALTIGLASWIVLLEAMHLKTRKPHILTSCHFYSKMLALTFGMGIISGLAIAFQLGTNWGGFSKIVGPVLGVLFTAETLTAFFVEALFLGFMLLAWQRLSATKHFLCSIMVWLGVMLSAFWIMAANSWMQTPAGVVYHHAQFMVMSWWQVVFNHSTLIRYAHMILASWLATLMLIIGIQCYYLIKQRHVSLSRLQLRLAIVLLAILAPLQVIVGDAVGIHVHEYQPIKTAAIEGLWHSTHGAPLLLFADVDQAQQTNHFAIGIPHLASLINTHQWHGYLQGLTTVAPELQPNVAWVFYTFRIMVALGLFMLAYAWIGCFLTRKQSAIPRWFLQLGIVLIPAGLIALVTGWYTAELGRQPWVVYGLLKTSDAVSHVHISHVMFGFVLLLVIYGIIFGYFFNRYMWAIIQKGPDYQSDTSFERLKQAIAGRFNHVDD